MKIFNWTTVSLANSMYSVEFFSVDEDDDSNEKDQLKRQNSVTTKEKPYVLADRLEALHVRCL